MSELRDQLAKMLYEGIRDTCGGYVEHVPDDELDAECLYYTTVDGPIDFGQLADGLIESLGLTEEWSDDIAGPNWGRHLRVVGKSTFYPGPNYHRSVEPTPSGLDEFAPETSWNNNPEDGQ